MPHPPWYSKFPKLCVLFSLGDGEETGLVSILKQRPVLTPTYQSVCLGPHPAALRMTSDLIEGLNFVNNVICVGLFFSSGLFVWGLVTTLPV